jgi:hypothetical protein
MISPYHRNVAETFLDDLARTVADAPVGDGAPAQTGTYGGIA